MFKRSLHPKRCLVLSPATLFGSWGWFSDVMKFSPKGVEYQVVSFGTPDFKPSNAEFHSLPDINYVKTGAIMGKKPFFFLNGLIYLPLVPAMWWVALKKRPKHLLGNGIAATTAMLPLKWITGAKLHLMYHGVIGHMGPDWQRLIAQVIRHFDSVVVNSRISQEDLSSVTNPDRIKVVDHWADPIFFEAPITKRSPGPLRLLYVGRMDPDKFGQCLRVAKKLAEENWVEFWIVGNGSIKRDALEIRNVVDKGYVSDRAELAKIYQSVDLIWTPADLTYLARPGIEAMASGVPSIVPDIPPVQAPGDNRRIPNDLIPADVGWVVDSHGDDELIETIKSISSNGISLHQRQACRDHAVKFHSVDNIKVVTDLFD